MNKPAPYLMDVSGCFDGPLALDMPGLEAYFKQADAAIKGLSKVITAGDLPAFSICDEEADILECEEVASDLLPKASDFVFLGTGGSSLGAQTLAQLTGHGTPGYEIGRTGPGFHYFDNLDAETFEEALAGLDLRATYFVVVSKSGGTAETLMQLFCALGAYEQAGIDPSQNFVVITEPKPNPLRLLAEEKGFRVLDHNPGIGGRFSVLSNVGLLPAILMGLDASAIREGAKQVLTPVLERDAADRCPPAFGSVLSVAFDLERNLKQQVVMPYADRLQKFGLWYRQIWAESLGKQGRGSTPINALGPVDQHSQLQLYLDGPNDKFHTIFTLNQSGKGARISQDQISEEKLGYLSGRTMGDLVDAEQRATIETLRKKGRPVRSFHIANLDEYALGGLLMHFMLETVISAHLLDVDAFDQPAVEDGKILARAYLNELD